MELFIHDNKNSFEELFKKAWKNYKEKRKYTNTLLNLKDLNVNMEREDIYLLARGRKKRIVLQALSGYFSLFNLDLEYHLIDLSKYEISLFKYAVLFEKIGFERIAILLNKKASQEIFITLEGYFKDIRLKYLNSE